MLNVITNQENKTALKIQLVRAYTPEKAELQAVPLLWYCFSYMCAPVWSQDLHSILMGPYQFGILPQFCGVA